MLLIKNPSKIIVKSSGNFVYIQPTQSRTFLVLTRFFHQKFRESFFTFMLFSDKPNHFDEIF